MHSPLKPSTTPCLYSVKVSTRKLLTARTRALVRIQHLCLHSLPPFLLTVCTLS